VKPPRRWGSTTRGAPGTREFDLIAWVARFSAIRLGDEGPPRTRRPSRTSVLRLSRNSSKPSSGARYDAAATGRSRAILGLCWSGPVPRTRAPSPPESVRRRGVVQARLVTDDPSCRPSRSTANVVHDGTRPANSAFPVRVCVATVPQCRRLRPGRRAAGAGEHPRHIVVFGDTGCRLRVRCPILQRPTAWPFHQSPTGGAKSRI